MASGRPPSAPARTQTWVDLAGLHYSWDLITHLVAREFRLRYRRAVLGWVWAIGSPLVRLVILTYVFTRVLPLGIDNYPVFVFTGLISWQLFAGGVTAATNSAINQRDLLFRPGLPRAAVPVVSVLTDGLDYLAALPVLVLFLILGDGIPVTAIALPGVLFVQFLLTIGLGFALCAANVYVRDVNLFVGMATMVGWYITPVFYDASSIPADYRFLASLNPMAHLLDAHRSVLIEGQLPGLGSSLLLTGSCLLVCVAGYFVYRRSAPLFVDEL